MEGNHIEVALHHHGPVVLADGGAGPLEAEEVLALLEQLRFGGVEVFGLAAIEAAATEADHPPLAVLDRHHHPMAEAVVETIPPLAGHHQPGGFQQLRAQPLHLLQVGQQAIPLLGGVAELEGLQGGLTEAPAIAQIGQGRGTNRAAQLAAEPAGRQGEHLVELLAAGELLAQALLLGPIEGFDRQLVLARQLQHHIAETLALVFHQELDRIATGPAGEAVVELLGGGHRHRRRFVVVKGTDADVFPALLLEHHVLADHIDDVGPFLDGLNRAGVETGKAQGAKGERWDLMQGPILTGAGKPCWGWWPAP